ncbi:hypothetical protein FB567DRAFT_592626 [Paraphoma chrysanthemicola]|uniref:Uncharacterized protein n=1 Tax=Paraphoma chrysanthemicola TaxID=798071 RepID=A0A8K0VY26_9PLEO|nr:hypothetical protein FB567DRAFT_592626 [Paraphoma chrysanthemicola]
MSTVEPKPTRSVTCDRRVQRDFPFLGLPAEIRNMIYSYVLGGRTITLGLCDCVNIYGEKPRQLSGPIFHDTGLVSTCRQIHTEAHMFPFQLNRFSLDRMCELSKHSFRRFTPAQLREITHVRIRLDLAISRRSWSLHRTNVYDRLEVYLEKNVWFRDILPGVRSVQLDVLTSERVLEEEADISGRDRKYILAEKRTMIGFYKEWMLGFEEGGKGIEIEFSPLTRGMPFRRQYAPSSITFRSSTSSTSMNSTPTQQHPHAAITQRNDRESPLLRLPGELRTRLYKLVLIENDGYQAQYPTRSDRYSFQASSGLSGLSILHTCRRILGEAALLPFSLNVFKFDGLWTLSKSRCQDTLNSTQLSAIRSIKVETECIGFDTNPLFKIPNDSLSKILPGVREIYVSGMCDFCMDISRQDPSVAWIPEHEIQRLKKRREAFIAWLERDSAGVRITIC